MIKHPLTEFCRFQISALVSASQSRYRSHSLACHGHTPQCERLNREYKWLRAGKWARGHVFVASHLCCVWAVCVVEGATIKKNIPADGKWCLLVSSPLESLSGITAVSGERDVQCLCVRVRAEGGGGGGGACNQKLHACRPGPCQSSSMWENESVETAEIRVKFTNNS